MKKFLLITAIAFLASSKSFAVQSVVSLTGNVSDQCSIVISSVPSSSQIGAILAHVQANSVITASLSIDCNQAGLEIKGQTSYGKFFNPYDTFSIQYNVELVGPNISSAGLKSGSSMMTETVMGTTMLGSGAGSELKVYPQVPSGSVPVGTYYDNIILSVTSL